MSTAAAWGSDVPVSMPGGLPNPNTMKIPMHGFCFTPEGLFHDITSADLEEFQNPTYAPLDDPEAEVVYGDMY